MQISWAFYVLRRRLLTNCDIHWNLTRHHSWRTSEKLQTQNKMSKPRDEVLYICKQQILPDILSDCSFRYCRIYTHYISVTKICTVHRQAKYWSVDLKANGICVFETHFYTRADYQTLSSASLCHLRMRKKTSTGSDVEKSVNDARNIEVLKVVCWIFLNKNAKHLIVSTR